MKTLKLAYRSFWPGFDPKTPSSFFFGHVLSQKYNVVHTQINPDVVVYSVFGEPAKKSDYMNNPLIIGFSGEPFEAQGDPDIRMGFAVTSDPTYYRLPGWGLHMTWDIVPGDPTWKFDDTLSHSGEPRLLVSRMLNRHKEEPRTKSNFCNFTYRNPVQSRIDFFNELSQYKQVESTGRLLNNTNRLMGSKPEELGAYKFTIAYENTILPGYITEKIMDPLSAGSVPIYCGGDLVTSEFNPDAFINARDFASTAELIEHIKAVDNDSELYYRYLTAPIFNNLIPWPTLAWERIYPELVKKNPGLAV